MEFCSKAVVIKQFGSYDCLSIEKIPLPSLDQKIEVEVHFCALNFADVYTRQGLIADRKLPAVLGIECAGIITAIGDIEDCLFVIGQRVLCYDHNGGLFQDVIRIGSDKCYAIPNHVSLQEAAGIFVSYLTGYFTIFKLGNFQPFETIFIQSCTGGVGCAATQLARTLDGVKILGTTSISKMDIAKANGVDHVLSYENVEEQIKAACPQGIDLIIENQAGKIFGSLQNLLKPLGRIILIGSNSIIKNDKKLSLVSFFQAWWAMKDISPISLIVNNRTTSGFHLGLLAEKEPAQTRKALDYIFSLLKDGKIKPWVDSIWPIEEIVNATKLLGERRNVGKVLLSMRK